jgi:hypothetical protein
MENIHTTCDGHTPVGIDAGFEVAPGDASDVEVVGAHAWGSYALVFGDGSWAHTALSLYTTYYVQPPLSHFSYQGKSVSFPRCNSILKSHSEIRFEDWLP